jgi:hypothetical protein
VEASREELGLEGCRSSSEEEEDGEEEEEK